MKCAGVAGGGPGDELLFSHCWLDSKLDASSPPPSCHEFLDSFLPRHQHEVKPLPPFKSINGISCHSYNALTQPLSEENNNYPTQSGYGGDHDVVSSSTCAADSEPTDLEDVKPFPMDTDTGAPDSCSIQSSKLFEDNQKQDIYDIDDFAAILSSAIADTTVPSQPEDPERNVSPESWTTDIERYLSSACSQHEEKIVPTEFDFGMASSPPPVPASNHHSAIDFPCKSRQEMKCSDFIQSKINQTGSALEELLVHGYIPTLQNRLTSVPPVKQEAPSSTSYGMDVISTSSPPGNAVSTTDGIGALINSRYPHYAIGLKQEGLCSPERILGYPHAHTTTPANKSKRSRAKAKQGNGGSLHGSSLAFSSATAADLSGLLGKEKPVHRCGICNRGFLNKSNIKVHLRTHTGEKPFRCDVCAKAFRQKAHLIKHQQIHKRIGRD